MPQSHNEVDDRIAARLKLLRAEQQWSLDELAARSEISRATLSRFEHGTNHPTVDQLGRLCSAFNITLSRLIQMAEGDFPTHIRPIDQLLWTDEATGFTRRAISPPAGALRGEAIECHLKPGTTISYRLPPQPGLEHHLYLLHGGLTVTIEGHPHHLSAGDSLRYQLHGASKFETGNDAARYLLFMV